MAHGSGIEWTESTWNPVMGCTKVSPGCKHCYAERMAERLRATPARVRFLSVEPFLGPLHDLDLAGIDWVIVGGESGPRARPMDAAWVTDLRDQCRRAGVPFFFKQWGGRNKKKAGRVLQGRTWSQMPSGEATSGLRLNAAESARTSPAGREGRLEPGAGRVELAAGPGPRRSSCAKPATHAPEPQVGLRGLARAFGAR